MIENFKIGELFKNKYFILATIIILFVNAIFVFTTLVNFWSSDDFPYIFGTKLYNLINNQSFFIYETDPNRFRPVYWFIIQFIPENYQVWHFIVVLIYIFSSILSYVVVKKITNNSQLSFLTSVLFTLNYSISVKSLSWGIFYGHIFNVFFGFINILLFIKIISGKKIKFFHITSFFIINLINFMITEGGMIYLFINFVIILFWKKDLIISKYNFVLINFLPLILYFFFSYLNSGNISPILSERLDNQRDRYYKNLFIKDGDSLYFYRSTYAPRDFKGYSYRLFDNFLVSFNLSLIEKNLKILDKTDSVKKLIKTNLYKIIFFSITFSILILFYLYRQLKSKKSIDEYYFYITLFLLVLLIYNFIYFRKDINLGLSFCSALLIAKIILDLVDLKKNILVFIILTIFISPTIISFFTGFKNYGDFNADKNIIKMNEYITNLNDKKKNNILSEDSNFKFFYYYHNFKNHAKELNSYKGNSLHSFYEKFSPKN